MKNRGQAADTPGLVTGLAYFVAEAPYRAYLSSYPVQTEVSNQMHFAIGSDQTFETARH